jgi:rSAM/selenodomain-associated transferase 2
MPAPLSVIIPTLNAARTIGPTLECLYGGMGKSLVCEVIFADGGSDDIINEIADNSGAKLITGPPGRGSQLHAGAKAAKGKWLLFIHADTVLSENWVTEMKRHITAHSKAGYCKLAFDSDGFAPRFIAGGANLRSRVFGLPYGDQTLLISKVLYDKTGGYPDIPLMEDVAFSRKLRSHLMALPITATTRSDRYVKTGWFRRTAQNLGTLILYFLGVSPDRLVKRYRR